MLVYVFLKGRWIKEEQGNLGIRRSRDKEIAVLTLGQDK